LFVFYVTSIFAQKPVSARISQVKISLKTAPTPIFKVKNFPNNTSLIHKWIVIGLEYVPLKNRKNNLSTFNFNDSFDIKFDVIVLKPHSKKLFLLSTTVPYWPISFDRKKHYALALIPLNFINKITLQAINNKFLKEMIKIKVAFYHNKISIGEAYYPWTKASARLFTAINSSSELTRLPGTVFNRSQTPWTLIDPNKYELIKQ